MRIGLVSSLMKDNDIKHQLAEMERHLANHKNVDLFCFGESFLRGFEGLTWDYDEDIKRAFDQNDSVIFFIRRLAQKYHCGISFGFIEKIGPALFSSYLIIDSDGKTINVFQRLSPGWKEPVATALYQEGNSFKTFRFITINIG